MCGIVSYIGFQSAYDVLIKGLKRLEYRGYDSAGLALIDNQGHLNIYKAKGRVSDLENATKNQNCKGTVGIAHTRWATHGVPSVKNAHPHCSQSGHLSLIHNGIIENYTSLKKHLIEKGYVFKSDTDTEVLVQLIEYKMKTYELDLIEATKSALKHVIGAYAIVILDDRNPYQLVAARKSSPLVIGIGEDNKEFFLASDVTPIVEYTDKVVYLEDERIAVIERNKDLFISDLENNVQIPDIQQIDMKLGQIEKGNYSHYMLKEISEQPQVIADCMRGRISPDHKHIILSAVIDYGYLLAKAKRIIIVACGTSWHAGLIGKQLIEEFCRIPVMVEYA
ncbi:MAG: isomerizing glutamine--fructose-6-phosphate transaminase, partial [Bacteroidaceae bacterium]